jgi:hypothetical protein
VSGLRGLDHQRYLGVSRPLESFDFMNRSWDVRLFEKQSPRSIFVLLLLDVFMLGVLTSMIVFDAVRFHRIDWSIALLLPVFVLPIIRYSPVIYRRLDS